MEGMTGMELAYTELKAVCDEVMKSLIRDTFEDVDDILNKDGEEYEQIRKVLKMYEAAMDFADEALKKEREDRELLTDILHTVQRIEDQGERRRADK